MFTGTAKHTYSLGPGRWDLSAFTEELAWREAPLLSRLRRPVRGAKNPVHSHSFSSIVSVRDESIRDFGGSKIDEKKRECIRRCTRHFLQDLEGWSINRISSMLSTNTFEPGVNGFPNGGGVSTNGLTEELINRALKMIWDQSSGSVDTILLNGDQKHALNLASCFYKSDCGEYHNVVVSRWVPSDTVFFLDSSKISVTPIEGRSFQYKPLSMADDSIEGQVFGEYTLEMKNEAAHGLIHGLSLDGK